METIRVKVHITGLVQGVWYRGSTQAKARELGLTGWVRNLRDGSVELEAEGAEELVEQLLGWCRRGPPAARVRDLEITHLSPTAAETTFEVRY